MSDSGQVITVDLAARSYPIAIGSGTLKEAGRLFREWLKIPERQPARCLLVADASLLSSHAPALTSSLKAAGLEVHSARVPSGESSKSYQQTQALYDCLVDMSADRRTVVVALGGGVTGDLAGFIAATYARGLRFIQVPTTLLSMVDSSVGGKTGINHPRGKNLIGAFHQPVGVLIDTSTLATLPDREYRSGLAEVIKYGVILDPVFFDFLESHIDGLNNRDPDVLRHVIARSCELKADVVRQDEYETTGLRAILNYGHTFGHAFEAIAGYGTAGETAFATKGTTTTVAASLLHGEAVSIGMVCASRLAEKLGRITATDTQRQRQLLAAVGLPVTVPRNIASRSDELVRSMMLDKKTEGRELRFVLPDRIGHVETVRGVTSELAIECIRDSTESP
jgi:3-dehydroquinate synthase